MERRSGLKEYSLGIITENKPYGSDYAMICPIENFSLEQDAIKEDTRDFQSKLPDMNGITKTAKLKGSAILRAKWIPYGNSNRDTAPDVRKNETVMIYQFGDTQSFYWDTLMREPELRRLEHVRYMYSNKPSGLDAFDSESSYWIEYSTVEKRIRLHTSDNDGEACKYDVTIKTDEGTITVEDSLGNFQLHDSVAGTLHAKYNTMITLEAPNIVFKASAGVTSDSPLTHNTGEEVTDGVSTAQPHVNCIC